jgi:hypothetical protein
VDLVGIVNFVQDIVNFVNFVEDIVLDIGSFVNIVNFVGVVPVNFVGGVPENMEKNMDLWMGVDFVVSTLVVVNKG